MRSAQTYRGARRNAARAEAKERKIRFLALFRPQFETAPRTFYRPTVSRSKYAPRTEDQKHLEGRSNG